jgi:hypothetical protein
MLIDEVKPVLRITASDFNGEIQGLIDAAKVDLRISGINNIDETDALIKRAIILYCKANFGYDNPDSDKFQKSYDMLKNHLALSSEYAVVDDNAT